jgi:hypothetical protein
MRISNDLTTSAPLPLLSAEKANTSSSVLSKVPSSMNMRMGVNEDGGGLCSWIKQLFETIRRFLGFSSVQTNETVSSTQITREGKIAEGKRILDTHFQSDFIRNATGPHTAMVVIIEYNSQCTAHSFRVPVNNHHLTLLKNILETQVERGMNMPSDNGQLSIQTMLFSKYRDFTFQKDWFDDSVNFMNGNKDSGSGSANRLSTARVRDDLNFYISDPAPRERILNFLLTQL